MKFRHFDEVFWTYCTGRLNDMSNVYGVASEENFVEMMTSPYQYGCVCVCLRSIRSWWLFSVASVNSLIQSDAYMH